MQHLRTLWPEISRFSLHIRILSLPDVYNRIHASLKTFEEVRSAFLRLENRQEPLRRQRLRYTHQSMSVHRSELPVIGRRSQSPGGLRGIVGVDAESTDRCLKPRTLCRFEEVQPRMDPCSDPCSPMETLSQAITPGTPVVVRRSFGEFNPSRNVLLTKIHW